MSDPLNGVVKELRQGREESPKHSRGGNRFSRFIWVLPVISAILCGWFLYKHFNIRGTEIHVAFTDASSLHPERTRVMFKGVVIGMVSELILSDDGTKAIAGIRLNANTERFARRGATFQIVSPRVSLDGVSGLETLISGSYIAATPGEGEPTTSFDGADGSPTNLSGPKVIFNLGAPEAQSVDQGDPIYYRGFKVGEVEQVDLARDGASVQIRVAVAQRYSRFVRRNSIFYKIAAVDGEVGFLGARVKIGALESLMKGGIGIWTPSTKAAAAKAGTNFLLLPDRPDDHSSEDSMNVKQKMAHQRNHEPKL